MEHFLDDSDYKNFRVFCLDEELTLGIGIYDRNRSRSARITETGEEIYRDASQFERRGRSVG